MQVGTLSASSGLDTQFLPDFLPFHIHALLLNPWATNKLLWQQPDFSLQFCLSLSRRCLTWQHLFLTPELGLDICARDRGRWGAEWGRNWGLPRVLEGKRVNFQVLPLLRSEPRFLCCCSCYQKNNGIFQAFHGDSGLQMTANRARCSCRQGLGGVWCCYLCKGLWKRINCITTTSKLICSQ